MSTPYSHSFTIPGLPKMANGGHGHWRTNHAERVKWKSWTRKCLIGHTPASPLQKIKVIFTRHSTTEPDFDGLVHGFKPIRDALVEGGIVVDDKQRNMDAVYHWLPAKRGSGHVSVVIVEVVP